MTYNLDCNSRIIFTFKLLNRLPPDVNLIVVIEIFPNAQHKNVKKISN